MKGLLGAAGLELVLVVEATGASTLDSYGPLLGGPNAGRIRADLDRWSKGSTSCS